MKADHWRGLDFYKSSLDHNNVLIVGVGHTGSYITYGLARLGVKNITICDFDFVEPHNLPNQFFSETLLKDYNEEDKKIFKVIMLEKTIKMIIPGIEMTMITDRVETVAKDILLKHNVIIFGVDSMEVRRWLFDFYENYASLIIDPRTGGEFARIFSILSGNDLDHCNNIYRASLHSDEEAVDLPCTGQAIIDVAMNVSGECIQRYRKFVAGHLKVMETFHDYSTCSHGIMNVYPSLVNNTLENIPVRDYSLVSSLGGHVKGNRNG